MPKGEGGKSFYSIFPNTFLPEVMEKFIQADPIKGHYLYQEK